MGAVVPATAHHLLEASEAATSDVALTRFSPRSESNLRTQFHRCCKLPGVALWPKVFPNRSSCEIALCRKHAEHLVCAWVGHSSAVAREHYLRPTDEDFKQASQPAAKPEAILAKSEPISEAVSVDQDEPVSTKT